MQVYGRRDGRSLRSQAARCLDPFGVTMGVTAGVEQNGTQTDGGGVPKTAWGVSHTALPNSAVAIGFFRHKPSAPNRASGEGEDGSDPPLFAAGAARLSGGCGTRCTTRCPTPHPPFGRSLPSWEWQAEKGPFGHLKRDPPFLSCGGRRDVAGRSGATGGHVATSAIAVAPPVSRGTRGCVWRL